MHSAAGGTIHRLNAGLATEWLRSKIDITLIEHSLPVSCVFKGMREHRLPLGEPGAFALPAAAADCESARKALLLSDWGKSCATKPFWQCLSFLPRRRRRSAVAFTALSYGVAIQNKSSRLRSRSP